MSKVTLSISFATFAALAAFSAKMEKAGISVDDFEVKDNETGANVKGTAVNKEAAPAETAEKAAGRGRKSTQKTEAAATTATQKTGEKKAFKDATPEEQLEAIRTIVTRHGKKGKTEEIKTILRVFGVDRAGELDEKDYVEAFKLLHRYNAGEKIEDIVPQDAGDDDYELAL